MGNYNDFDLDIKKVQGNDADNPSAKSTSWLSQIVSETVVTNLTCHNGCTEVTCENSCGVTCGASCGGHCR